MADPIDKIKHGDVVQIIHGMSSRALNRLLTITIFILIINCMIMVILVCKKTNKLSIYVKKVVIVQLSLSLCCSLICVTVHFKLMLLLILQFNQNV